MVVKVEFTSFESKGIYFPNCEKTRSQANSRKVLPTVACGKVTIARAAMTPIGQLSILRMVRAFTQVNIYVDIWRSKKSHQFIRGKRIR